MEEQEFNRLMDILDSIDEKLSDLDDIKSNTSPAYDASDVCNRLDTIIKLLEDKL